MKFYPSSSAFMVGDTVVTKYNSGCLRSILIQSHGIREGDIPEAYQRVGAEHERVHEQELNAQGVLYVREMVTKAQLSDKVEYSGRADFVCTIPNVGTVIDECKGHSSKNTRRDVIRNGEYNISYLAQLVSYMTRFRTQKGRLVCGYYEETEDGALVRQEERTFKVEIDDAGGIDVDAVPSGYSVADLLAHQRAAVRVLENQEVAARPDKWNQKFGGPCTFCPFKAACDQYDTQGGSVQEFLESAKAAVKALPPKKVPEINKVSKRNSNKAG
jgi:hypothetical protein